jgi:signal transduction histidine kinase
MKRLDLRTAAYIGLLAASFVVAWAASVRYGARIDNYAYDYMFMHYRPPAWKTESVLLAIDERTLDAYGGMPGVRKPLAEGLRIVAGSSPKAVALDVILANAVNPQLDAELTDAIHATPRLVLATQLLSDGSWEDPLPMFQGSAVLGHVHSQPDRHDSIVRSIPLEKHSERTRRWAMSLEAYRLSIGGPQILETPTDLQVGGRVIPIPAKDVADRILNLKGDGRPMRVRFVPPDNPLPVISLKVLIDNPARAAELRDKVVFIGSTSQTENDRLFTPLDRDVPTNGIEINANAFETIAQGRFLTDVSEPWVLLFALTLAAAAGISIRLLPGWQAIAAGVVTYVAALLAPYIFFTYNRVFSFVTPAFAAGLAILAAASYKHLVVRRMLRRTEAERTRYQQAMHFVTHEMRTPLSAIQGSSELISRYSLTEAKRKQIADLINSESKRLARMVEIFLSVERLSAGHMELKQESITVKDLVELCVLRVRPLAERKHIGVTLQPIAEELRLSGDRELIEYACYNLLTNAVKYSPQRTEVTVSGAKDGGQIRIAVQDQGIGMDQKEVKQIFQKFYRTKKAEESGEVGTGIGLSIVQQIVEQHGGRIDVTSQPGAGSCFTLVLPAAAHTPVPTVAERH